MAQRPEPACDEPPKGSPRGVHKDSSSHANADDKTNVSNRKADRSAMPVINHPSSKTSLHGPCFDVNETTFYMG